MGLISKGTGGGTDFEPMPLGTHIARCVSVVDLGLQQDNFGIKEKVYIAWEVPSVRVKWTKDDVEHEGPAIIGSRYSNFIHPKSNLGEHLVNWRGRAFTEIELEGFDLFTILGVPCMISVTHNTKGDKTYANVSAAMGLPAGTVCPEAETPLLKYSANDPSTAAAFDKLPEWLRKLCLNQAQPESKPPPGPASLAASGADDFDDDIPF